MAKLFAAHLVQESSPITVLGKYDPEQELWVGDNQFQGVNPFGVTNTNTKNPTAKYVNTWELTGILEDTDIVKESDEASDSDEDEY